jgi:hypothetical protein
MTVRSKLILPALLLVAGCAPLRMGETQATLVDLLNRQERCDSQRAAGALDQRSATECIEISDALVKMAGELGEEARKTGTSKPNAVFFYRRAATAAWRSEVPKAMNDAITYAKAATEICPKPGAESEIPPGDCALAALIPALVTHDQGMIAYRPLSRSDGLGDQEERRKLLLGADYATKTWPADAPLVDASKSAYGGWTMLRAAAVKNACDKALDPSVQDYVGRVHADMVKNLQSMSRTMSNAVPGLPHADGEYAKVCEKDTVTSDQGKRDAKFQERAKSELWCRYRYAASNKPACP